MNSIKERLDEEISAWEKLKVPALMQRFVSRHGRPFNTPTVPRKRMKPKECFANAAKLAPKLGGFYVEGYMTADNFPILIHHAWVVIDDDVIEPTLQSGGIGYSYFGIAFELETVLDEIVRNGVYGLLDTGTGINSDLMFRLDPALRFELQAKGFTL